MGGSSVTGFSTVGAPPPEQPASTATAAAAVNQRTILNCIAFMCAPSIAHAVHGGFGEHLFQPIAVVLEPRGDRLDFVAIGLIARRAEAHRLEHLLHLALGEGVAVGQLLA